MGTIRVGIAQVSSHGSKLITMEKIDALLKKHRIEADIIVFPEYIMADPTNMEPWSLYSISEKIDGPWIEFFKEKSNEYSAAIITTLFERTETQFPKVYNTSVFIEGDKVKGIYRKTHLFDAYGYKESNLILKGEKTSDIVEYKGFKIAMAVCFDLRFPELFRTYALEGAQLVAVPSAWYKGNYKEETLIFLSKTRSHENTIYTVISSNPGENFIGRSMIINPMGIVELDLGYGEKYKENEISSEYLHKVRKTLPVLEQRRPDIYNL